MNSQGTCFSSVVFTSFRSLFPSSIHYFIPYPPVPMHHRLRRFCLFPTLPLEPHLILLYTLPFFSPTNLRSGPTSELLERKNSAPAIEQRNLFLQRGGQKILRYIPDCRAYWILVPRTLDFLWAPTFKIHILITPYRLPVV